MTAMWSRPWVQGVAVVDSNRCKAAARCEPLTACSLIVSCPRNRYRPPRSCPTSGLRRLAREASRSGSLVSAARGCCMATCLWTRDGW